MSYEQQSFELEQHFRPFGREKAIFGHIKAIIENDVDACWVDRFGSLVAHKKGTGKKIMLSTQVDVPTIIITYVHENGAGRFLITGKEGPELPAGTTVKFSEELIGTIEYDDDCSGPSDCKKMKLTPLKGSFAVGDRGIIFGQTGSSESFIYGAHCEETAGCVVLLELIRKMRGRDLDLYYVFSVGSESDMIGHRGVKCAIYNLKPDVGISIEALCCESSGIVCRRGPTVLLRDAHTVLRDKMRKLIQKAQTESGVPLQYGAVPESSRETAMYHYHCAGADATAICIPTAKRDAGIMQAAFSDIEQTALLCDRLLQEVSRA